MFIYISVLLIAGFLGGLISARSLPKAAVVDLGYNRYQGVSLLNEVDQYLGMRYAKAPIHDLRFRAPEDPDTNSKLLDASTVSRLHLSFQNRLTVLVRPYLCRRRTASRRFFSRGLLVRQRLEACECFRWLESPRVVVHPGWRLRE